jgi:hypothetical protein
MSGVLSAASTVLYKRSTIASHKFYRKTKITVLSFNKVEGPLCIELKFSARFRFKKFIVISIGLDRKSFLFIYLLYCLTG